MLHQSQFYFSSILYEDSLFINSNLKKMYQTGRGEGRRCTSSTDCKDHLTCKNRQCKNPCDDRVCVANTDCTAANHRAICSCKSGYHGHPTTECTTVQRCTYNADCDLHLSCREGRCVDSCATECKNSRKCKVISHVPDCTFQN